MAKKRLLNLADLHVGSRFGLSKTRDNATQRELYTRWRDMIEHVGSVDIGVLNGDICEGMNHEEDGEGVELDAEDQITEAADLLSMIDCKAWYGTQGSKYHTKANPSMDWSVLRELKGDFRAEQVLTVNKTRFHFSHKVGVSSSGTMYHGTPISKELMMAALNEGSMGKFHVIGRAHAHYFFEVRDASTMAYICPCFKGRDKYASLSSQKWSPHIGYVYFDIYDGDGEYAWAFKAKKLDTDQLFENEHKI